MTAPDTVTDPELEAVAWDLSTCSTARATTRRPPSTRLLADAQERADAFAAAHAGKVAELDGPGPRRRHARARGDRGARRPRRHLRDRCASPSTPPTPPAARCCSACRRRPRRSRPRCCSSSSSGPRSTTRAPRSCSPPTGWTSPATTCAPRAATGRTCSPSPRSGSSPRSALTGRTRLGAAVRGADVGDHGRRCPDATEPVVARGRALAPVLARPRGAPRHRRARHRRRSQPGPAHARATRSTRCWRTR